MRNKQEDVIKHIARAIRRCQQAYVFKQPMPERLEAHFSRTVLILLPSLSPPIMQISLAIHKCTPISAARHDFARWS
jgi:hypothetical protein